MHCWHIKYLVGLAAYFDLVILGRVVTSDLVVRDNPAHPLFGSSFVGRTHDALYEGRFDRPVTHWRREVAEIARTDFVQLATSLSSHTAYFKVKVDGDVARVPLSDCSRGILIKRL